MLKIICDKCGSDCGRNAYELRIGVIRDPVPLAFDDAGDMKLTDTLDTVRFILCQNCYKKAGMPSVYKTIQEKKITFRDRGDMGAEESTS